MIGNELLQLLKKARKERQTVVLATGVFDILHQEHINFLTKAKKEGDVLIVGLESDSRVKKIKGEGRPINQQNDRLKNLTSLNIADYVFILPEKFDSPTDHIALITQIKPDVLAVSSHTSHLEEKAKIVEKLGGRLKIVHQHNPGVSSTMLIDGR